MDTFRHNEDVIVVGTSPSEASAASYRVVDEIGTEIIALTAVPAFAAGLTATVTIGEGGGALPEGQPRGLRSVEFVFIIATGTSHVTEHFVVEQEETLIVGENSAQTLGQAFLTAYEVPELKAWDSTAVTDDDRKRALIAAYDNLSNIVFTYEDADGVIIETEGGLADLTVAEFGELDAGLIAALKKAQVAQADLYLGGDPIGEMRRQGIISHTIGEVSQFFRGAAPLKLPVDPKAYRYIAKYALRRHTIGRA